MIYVGLYGYKWFLGKYIVGVGLLTYSHMFLNGSILATPVYIYIYMKINNLGIYHFFLVHWKNDVSSM
jgi:hypothetical protein